MYYKYVSYIYLVNSNIFEYSIHVLGQNYTIFLGLDSPLSIIHLKNLNAYRLMVIKKISLTLIKLTAFFHLLYLNFAYQLQK